MGEWIENKDWERYLVLIWDLGKMFFDLGFRFCCSLIWNLGLRFQEFENGSRVGEKRTPNLVKVNTNG